MTAALEHRIAVLERRIARMERRRSVPFALGRTTTDPVDKGNVQTVQVQLDALTTVEVPVQYHHGFFAMPPIGSDVTVAFLDGDRGRGFIVGTGNQPTRFKNAGPGDTGLFALGCTIHLSAAGITITDKAGSSIALTNDGNATVTNTGTLTFTGSQNVNFRAQNVNFSAQDITLNATVGLTIETPIVDISNALALGLGPITVNGTQVVVP